MVQATFLSWRVAVDLDATRALHATLRAPDPACCSACATFRDVLREGLLPAQLLDFLAFAGADPAKAQQPWGAPESGFLNWWWVVAGSMLDPAWDGSAEKAFVEPVAGMACWITSEPPMPQAVQEGQPLLRLEVAWTDASRLPTLRT